MNEKKDGSERACNQAEVSVVIKCSKHEKEISQTTDSDSREIIV